MQQTAQILNLLSSSLNPQLTNQAHSEIQKVRGRQGFAINLLMIAVDEKCNMPIRQSALVTLKNLIADQCKSGSGGVMNRKDWQTIKSSILEALIRCCAEKKLTPTIRQIIFKIAGKDYPERWTDIVPTILDTFAKCQDLQRIYACVEALRAIASIYGTSFQKQISLNNLCNKIMIPLNKLAAFLFQNFNQASELILQSVFKIFSTVIYFHMPEIVAANIHSWMIFLKKILDIPSSQMNNLKRICLKIMFKLYQKHFNKAIKNTTFVHQFHEKYTTPILETLILQIFSQNQTDKNKELEMIGLSLSCLPYIYKDHEQSAVILTNSLDKIVFLCLKKFTLPQNFSESSVTQFISFLQEQRNHFVDLIKIFISQKQNEQVITNRILSLLLEKIQNGSLEQKQIALYVFGQISTEIKYMSNFHQKMLQALLTCVIPLMQKHNTLSNKGHMIINARICEIISSYDFINFPENTVQPICKQVYNCLLSKNNSYLNVYACKAFTSLLRYESIVKYLVPYLGDILKTYVGLMEQVDLDELQFSMEQMLENFENYLGPYAANLGKCFIDNFYKANKSNDSSTNPCQMNNNNDDDEQLYEQDQQDSQNTQKSYLVGIRQILLANLPQNCYVELQDDLFALIVYIMRDSSQSFMQEGLNLLNIILFKTNPENINQKYYHLYPVLIYSLIGIPQQLIEKQQSKQISLPAQFQEMLTNFCVDPDPGIIQNVIGSLRNYISKMGFNKNSLLRNKTDYLGNSFIGLALDAVEKVHGNANVSFSDRSIVLTIYITLLEYQCLDVNQRQLGRVLNLITQGLQFQETQETAKFSAVYLQILGLAAYYYEQYFIKYFNIEYFLSKLLCFWSRFTNDFQKQRIILGVGKLIQQQAFKRYNSKLVFDVIRLLPKFLQEQCSHRNAEGQFCNRSESDQAIDQDQQNTHIMGIRKAPNANMNKQQQQGSEDQWDTEFNKLYLSPSQKIEQLGFIGEVLKNQGRQYVQILSMEEKHILSSAITNAKPRN